MWPYAYYVTLGSCCNSSSEDETDTLPERPTRIQLYQFEPVRQDFERVPEHRVSFEANPMRYSMGFVKSHSLKCSLHKWEWCGTARKSARLNCINLIHFHLTAGRLRGSSCIVIPGVVFELLQFAATQCNRVHLHIVFVLLYVLWVCRSVSVLSYVYVSRSFTYVLRVVIYTSLWDVTISKSERRRMGITTTSRMYHLKEKKK